jgi:phosphoserine phosphatase
MLTALTLICNPGRPLLGDELASRLMLWLDHEDWAGAVSRRVLASGVAEDYLFEIAPARRKELSDAVRRQLGEVAADVVIQPAEGRRKKLLVADMDSTIIGQECIDELADLAGKRAEISAITDRAMRGELDFESALLERVAMLEGLPERALAETFLERVKLNPGARTLVATMKKAGATTALVSGGFTYFTARVASAAGFDAHQANVLLVKNGVLTGDVERPILGRAAKEEALVRIAREKGLAPEATLAVGDGANDLSMLKRAGLGVAYHAKPAVAAAASARIDHGDLTALLYLQGIGREEFVQA